MEDLYTWPLKLTQNMVQKNNDKIKNKNMIQVQKNNKQVRVGKPPKGAHSRSIVA